MPSFDVLLFRLLLALAIGGLIGAEREYRSKSAGFRTMILICLGSFLFTSFSISISGATNDRIASNIGFLGTLKNRRRRTSDLLKKYFMTHLSKTLNFSCPLKNQRPAVRFLL